MTGELQQKPLSGGGYFSPKRFLLISRLETAERWNLYFLSGLIVAGIFFAFALFKLLYQSPVSQGSINFYFGLNLFVGIIVAGNIFSEIHTPERAHVFYLNPAALEEKFLAKLLLSTLVYFLYSVLVIFTASAVIGFLTWIKLKCSIILFNPFTVETLKTLALYAFFHSIFFFGAAFFKKHNFIKTVAALIALFIGLNATVLGIMAALGSNMDPASMNSIRDFLESHTDSMGTFFKILKYVLWILIPAALYTGSYLLLKRKQVRE